LHAWQAAAAAGLLFALWQAAPGLRLRLWEQGLVCALGVLAAGGLLTAWDPQAHLNACLWLGGGLLAALLARRAPGWTPAAAARLVAGTGIVLGGVFLASGYGFAQAFSGTDLSGPVVMPHLSARWFSPNQNLLAAGWVVPALLVCAAAAQAGKRWAWLGLGLGLGALVYAGSRGAYLSLGAGLAWWVLRQPRRAPALALAALIVVSTALLAWRAPFSRLAVRWQENASAGAADQNYYRRSDFWRGALSLSREAPWTGRGLGSFPTLAWRLDLPVQLDERAPIARYRLRLEHAHDEWLELAVESGWLWTAAVALAVLAWLWHRWRQPLREAWSPALEAGIVAALALSLVDMNLRTPGILALLLFSAAALDKVSQPAAVTKPWGWSLMVLLALLSGLGLWALRFAALNPRPGQDEALLAACLQPLDGRVQARRLEQGAVPFPWASWSARHELRWHWALAEHLSTQGVAEARTHAAAITSLRPYWAPGWMFRAYIESRVPLARGDQRANGAVAEALRLEPNYCSALAWQVDEALDHGRLEEAKALLRHINAVQDLRFQQEDPDAYSLQIQAVDAGWLAARNKSLHLSTTFRPKS
jgi:O-antigen ligase